MAENANESWRKPTNIQLLCLVLSTSSVQKAVSMNSEQFLSWRPNKKTNKYSSSSCSKHFAHALTPVDHMHAIQWNLPVLSEHRIKPWTLNGH